jgi:protein-disulfide isomerase
MNFALDADLDLNIIRLLKSVYRVRGVPTLVIDGRSYEGLVSLEQLKQILCEKLQICE